ncbi:MAG: OmpA family protein [Planctomycetota bacterium]
MPTSRLTIALLALSIGFAGCVSNETHRRVLGANEALRAQIADLTEHQQKLNQENERLRADVERLGKLAKDATWIAEQKEKLSRLLADYKQGGPQAIPGIDLVRTSEGNAFRAAGSLLFASGKAEVTPEGRAALAKVVVALKQEGCRVRVDGFTDDQPIQHSAWRSNLELSVARALSVADFLIQNGIPPELVAVAGFGEYRPAVEGTSEEARQRNRRVEILMLDR